MANEITLWNKVMSSALSMPGVKVDRESFLCKELSKYCTADKLELILRTCPQAGVSARIIDSIANSCINSHTTKVTAISGLAGIPGGFTMAATIPADMAQYYWHVFVLSQKLAYLYGFPDLCDEKGNLSDSATDMLTVFVGVMMGAAIANQAIHGIARELAKQVVIRLPKQALTKTVYYPIIKQVAKWVGVKLTKDSFAKGVGKVIPFIGGVISGGVTLCTFRPGAKRLQHKLQDDMDMMYNRFGNNTYQSEDFSHDNNQYDEADYEDVKDESDKPSEEKVILMLLINMAKIDHAFTDKKKMYVEQEIENSNLSDDEKFELATSLNEEGIFEVDLSILKGKDTQIVALLEKLLTLCKLDGKISLAEKLYLKRIARVLDFPQEDLEEFINA